MRSRRLVGRSKIGARIQPPEPIAYRPGSQNSSSNNLVVDDQIGLDWNKFVSSRLRQLSGNGSRVRAALMISNRSGHPRASLQRLSQ